MTFQRWFGQKRPIITQSPTYRFSKTTFTAAEVYAVNLDVDTNPYGYYTPFNYIQITNNTNADLILVLDTGTTKTIVSGTIVSFGSDVVPSFRNFQLQGASGGNTGTAEVIIQKVIDYKEAIRIRDGLSPYGQ